ncbi:hypothetical protein L596_028386 [Steinernema carpocapsae]|uniref:SLC12A transporter C-terminal domain-containing protein n=1 Tax=Steinernema carpocapsae TaxID=34508 RepID=A0A4U5LYE7_STECR|nr:hypothetical protein L596_028386 [Steinernema carpocapsae]
MLSKLFAFIEDFKVRQAYGILRWIKSKQDARAELIWYPIVLMLHLDESREPLVERQSLIAFCEWIRFGTPSYTMCVLVERLESQDTEKYLDELEKCLKVQISESCINVHSLMVTFQDSGDLSETASAVIQCTSIGALIPNTLVVNFPHFHNLWVRKNYNDVTLYEFWKKIVTYERKCIAICKGELWKIKPMSDVLTVDIWWVVEEDDILLLFMYLITNWRKFVDAKVRLFPVISKLETEEAESQMTEAINERVTRSLVVAEMSIQQVKEETLSLYKGLRLGGAETTELGTIEESAAMPAKKRVRGKNELNAKMHEKSLATDLIFVNVPKWNADWEPHPRKFFAFLGDLTEKLNQIVLIRPPAINYNIKK